MEDIDIESIRTFDTVAPVYDRGRHRWYKRVAELVRRVQLGSPLLDAGCGTGEITLRLLDAVDEVVALDCAENMVYALKKKASRRKKLHRVHLLVACLPHLPFRRELFSSVIAVAVLHSISRRELRVDAMSELLRVCRRDGTVVLTVWSRLYPRNFLKALKFALQGRRFGDVIVPWKHRGRRLIRFYHLYTPDELRLDLERAGARKIKVFGWSHRDRKFFKENIVAVIRKDNHAEGKLHKVED